LINQATLSEGGKNNGDGKYGIYDSSKNYNHITLLNLTPVLKVARLGTKPFPNCYMHSDVNETVKVHTLR
jgi:hypothetical protein